MNLPMRAADRSRNEQIFLSNPCFESRSQAKEQHGEAIKRIKKIQTCLHFMVDKQNRQDLINMMSHHCGNRQPYDLEMDLAFTLASM